MFKLIKSPLYSYYKGLFLLKDEALKTSFCVDKREKSWFFILKRRYHYAVLFMNKIKELQKAGKTIVCVHHDLHTLKKYFDHVVFINKYVIANGKIDDVLTEENIRKTYQNDKYNTDTILL